MPTTREKALSDYLLAKNDVAEFIDRFCYIQDPNRGTTDRFRLWDFQRELLGYWGDNRLSIILKARQLGISWLSCAYALWLVNFYEDIHIICISKTQDKAYGLIDKIKFMYDRLPAHLKQGVFARNAGKLSFNSDVLDENGKPTEGSWIMALPSTPGSAVSYTATLVIVDEWAEQDYAEELFTAFKPTIDMGGRMIGISTGNAIGSFFHEVWTKARAGENGFFPYFLPYSVRPGRDPEWYERTKRSYPREQEFYQQYPRNEVEAFLAAGGCPFQIEDINWYLDTHVAKYIPTQDLLGKLPESIQKHLAFDDLQIWKLPEAKPYLVSFDPATGKEQGDYHAIQIFSIHPIEQVAELRSRCDLDIAAEVVREIAQFYNQAEIVWETTGIGHSITALLIRSTYEPLYKHIDIEVERNRKHKSATHEKLGWPATTPNIFRRDTDLIGAIREHDIIIHSARWFDEAKAFVRQPNGRYGASGRAHDDLVTSLGMCYQVILTKLGQRTERTRPTKSWKRTAFRKEKWR